MKQTGSGGCRTGSPQSNTNNIHIFGLKKYIYIIYIVLSFGLKYLMYTGIPNYSLTLGTGLVQVVFAQTEGPF